MAVILVPLVSQCAEMQSIAAGVGRVSPNCFHFREKILVSMAFIGLPWPTNNAGMALGRVGSACKSDMLGVLLMRNVLVVEFAVVLKSQWVAGLPKRLDVKGPRMLAVSAPPIGMPMADLINFLRSMPFCLFKQI